MMSDNDTTYGRNARKERQNGRQAAASARDDAMGELYCEVCGLKRAGKTVCPECRAGRDLRVEAANDYSETFPIRDLADARKYVRENGEGEDDG